MRIVDVKDSELVRASKLEEIRRTAEHRLQEIQPLIEEADQLRDVLSVINERQHGRVMRARNGNGAHKTSRASKGANKRVILDLIAKRPGITNAEIAETTRIKLTVVASTVSRLKRYGELEAHGRGARVAVERRSA